uniref:Uncharacterized protein n=1 Tax=Oryza barthii TaxID=65489 RepID=A0A0D3EJ81_9ORYZ
MTTGEIEVSIVALTTKKALQEAFDVLTAACSPFAWGDLNSYISSLQLWVLETPLTTIAGPIVDVTSDDEKGWPPLPTLLPLRARWVADKGAPGGKKDSQEGERRRRCRRAMEIEWGDEDQVKATK